MKKNIIFCMVLCAALAFCLYLTPSASAASAEEEVLQVATNFCKAISDNNAELLTSLWWQSPKTTYFNPGGRFLTQGWMTNPPGGGEAFSLHHPQVTMLGDNAAFITGYYMIMKVNMEKNEFSTEYTRETIIVQKIQGKWLIVHEHSSFVP
jgi:hypothetical protein